VIAQPLLGLLGRRHLEVIAEHEDPDSLRGRRCRARERIDIVISAR